MDWGNKYLDMNKFLKVILLFLLTASCTTGRYIHDDASAQRHKNLRGNRAGNIVGNALITTGSLFLSALLGGDLVYIPEDENQYKKVSLHNTSNDTLTVNMLTDYLMNDTTYCDFLDIRIPPGAKCRLLMPRGATYNLYFSNTPEPDDDEMIEINTRSKKRIVLYPGMTKVNNF